MSSCRVIGLGYISLIICVHSESLRFYDGGVNKFLIKFLDYPQSVMYTEHSSHMRRQRRNTIIVITKHNTVQVQVRVLSWPC